VGRAGNERAAGRSLGQFLPEAATCAELHGRSDAKAASPQWGWSDSVEVDCGFSASERQANLELCFSRVADMGR